MALENEVGQVVKLATFFIVLYLIFVFITKYQNDFVKNLLFVTLGLAHIGDQGKKIIAT